MLLAKLAQYTLVPQQPYAVWGGRRRRMDKPTFKDGAGRDLHYPERDEGLLLSATRLATGANIHDVNEAKSYYINALQYAQGKPSALNYSRANEYKRLLQILLIKIERENVGRGRKGKQ
jgi:hypothetical protein